MLIASGDMQASFKHKASANLVRVYNTAPYFKYHQSSEEPRKRLPRRVMMSVNDTIEVEVNRIINTHVKQQIAG